MDSPPLMLKQNISTLLEGRVHVDSSWQPSGVTNQFLDDAETYHNRYTSNHHWRKLVERALDYAGVDRQSSLRVLDIGSGSGNTVFAAVDLMPNSIITASDISPQLLQMLVGIQENRPDLEGRIEAYCFDLHKDFFADDTFDIALGGSILHHMLDPEAALRNVVRWLRPGGKILLFEPMEIGGHIMTAIYLSILDELESDLDPGIATFFKALCHDNEARFGVPRVKPWTQHLDDKWLFHPSYLRDLAKNLGITLEMVAPTGTEHERLFSNAVRVNLEIAGLGDLPTPERLWELLRNFDEGISTELKRRFALEGIIILAKN